MEFGIDSVKVEDEYSIKLPNSISNFTDKSFEIKLDNNESVRVDAEDTNLIRTCFCVYTTGQKHEKYDYKIHTFILISNMFELSVKSDESIAITYDKMILHLMPDEKTHESYLKIHFCNSDMECQNVIKRQLGFKDDQHNNNVDDEAVFFYTEQQDNKCGYKQLEILLEKCLKRKFVFKIEDYSRTITPVQWTRSDFINCIQFVCIFEDVFQLQQDDDFTRQLHTFIVSVYGDVNNKWSTLSHDEFWSVFKQQKKVDEPNDVPSSLSTEITFDEWKAIREETIMKLKEIVEWINYHHKNINVSKLSGSLAGLVGTSMGLLGLIAIPLTAGFSIPIAVGGFGLGISGSAVNIGTCITEYQIMKKLCSEATNLIERDIKISNNFSNTLFNYGLEEQKSTNSDLNTIMKDLTESTSIGHAIANQDSLKFISAATKVLGFGLSVLSVGLDTVELVKTTKEVTEGSKNELAKKLELVIKQLESNKDELIKYFCTSSILYVS